MREIPILILVLCLLYSCQNDESPSNTSVSEEVNLTEKWGADEYGMRQYVMALLKAGPNRNQDSLTAAKLQTAHLENINRMAEDGKLVIAGPFMDDWEVRGIYIFAVETVEEAEALTATDPAIKAGRLTMELHPWYGSAALMELRELHKKLESRNITE